VEAVSRPEPLGWNYYWGANGGWTFMYFIPNKPRLDRREYHRRQRARVKRRRR
jgi:hypothetical protein